VDAALGEWIPKAKLVLLGADAVMRESVASKVGAEALLRAARRARVPAYVMADSSKWLPPALAGFWRVRAEAPEEIAHLRHPKVTVHNRYFGTAPLTVVAGVVWEEGVARPGDIRRRIARLPVSGALVRYLRKARPA
jgi:translation initiation factor 2B subunit (eIF-2B alpha/beta/delta family)